MTSHVVTSRDDRILLATRVVAALIVPVLLVAAAILYLWPGETARLWAWPIQPRMTALVMGAGYLSGAYFFTRVLGTRCWHHVARGFLPITAFTWVLAVATILHWDRFTQGHPAFLAWVVLYGITPLLIPALWLRNRVTDPQFLQLDEAVAPGARVALAGIGLGGIMIALVLFLSPGLSIRVWPWHLTALAARTLAGWFVLTGAVGVSLASERRWSAWRVLIEAAMVWAGLILVAAVRAWPDFDQSNLLTWLALGGLAVVTGGLAAGYGMMETRRRRAPEVRPTG
jgi:hypothetical protein